MFYRPSTQNIIETDNVKFIEDIQKSESYLHNDSTFEEEQIVISMANVKNDEVIVSLQHESMFVHLQSTITVHPEVELNLVNEVKPEDPQTQVPPRRSTRERKSAIVNEYVVYLQEHELNIGLEDDPTSLNEAKLSVHSTK